MAHGLDRCEVSVMIPFNPMEPWSGSIVGSELDTSIVMMAHIALTSLCEVHLYYSTAYRTSPNSESGEHCMVAAP
jgi:hypothetical protein